MELGLRGDLPRVKDGLREVEKPSQMVLAEEWDLSPGKALKPERRDPICLRKITLTPESEKDWSE